MWIYYHTYMRLWCQCWWWHSRVFLIRRLQPVCWEEAAVLTRQDTFSWVCGNQIWILSMRRREVFRNISATFEATKPGGHEKTPDIFLLWFLHEMPAVFSDILSPNKTFTWTSHQELSVPEHLHRCLNMKLIVNQETQLQNNHCQHLVLVGSINPHTCYMLLYYSGEWMSACVLFYCYSTFQDFTVFEAWTK